MELRLTDTAKQDIRYFLKSGQATIVKKIEKLLISIQETPFNGIGKPEPLKHKFAGKWSRRIDREHRLIYDVNKETIIIIQFGDITIKLCANYNFQQSRLPVQLIAP